MVIRSLNFLDIAIILAVLLITLLMVVYANLKKPNKKNSVIDIMLAGRKLTLPLFVPSLVSTWYGGVLGVSQISFEHGIYNFFTQGVFWYISYIIFAFFLVKPIKKAKVKSLAELCEKFFGNNARNVCAIFNVINLIPISYSLALGIVIDALFGLGYFFSIIISTSAVCLYTAIGGFRSVVITDIFQFILMFFSVLIVLFFSVSEYGSINYLKNNLPESHFSITGGMPITSLILWGLIAFSTLVDPNFYHRILAAANEKTAKIGLLISILMWMIFDIATTAGGMYAKAAMNNADSKNAYLHYAMDLLPTGLKGLFLAGLIASILSTLDSYLFLSSSTISYDLQHKKTNFLKSYRINLLIVSIISIMLACVFVSDYSQVNGIKDVWIALGSYSSGCVLVPMIAGVIIAKKSLFTKNYFLYSTILSAIMITAYRLFAQQYISKKIEIFNEIDSLYIGILTSLIFLFCNIFSVRFKLKT